jgi:hypothetical protein
MKPREIAFLAVGLVVGLGMGIFTTATNRDLSQLLSGTAGLPTDSAYYLVDVATAGEWLIAQQGDETDESLNVAVETVVGLVEAENFRTALVDAESAITEVISTVYTAVGGDSSEASGTSVEDAPASACLGLDDNPYSVEGAGLYIYLKLPAEQTDRLPEEWEAIETPKTNDLYWQLLACYPEVSPA